jgi:hypothetical protein
MEFAKMTLQEKFHILFEKPGENRASFILNTIVYILIVLSILNLMFYSVEPMREKYGYILEDIRNIIMPIFILENYPTMR